MRGIGPELYGYYWNDSHLCLTGKSGWRNVCSTGLAMDNNCLRPGVAFGIPRWIPQN